MLKYITAGESHGIGLLSIIENMPSNLSLSVDDIDDHLARRQKGYGRGGRMAIESDSVQIISGVRHGKTTGAPIALMVDNRDWENWSEIMSPSVPAVDYVEKNKKGLPVTRPRPGHADLTGALKYNQRDMRNILERSSARETAARVAAGSVARKFLNEFGVEVYSWVTEIGGVVAAGSGSTNSSIYYSADESVLPIEELYSIAEKSEVRYPDNKVSGKIKDRIDRAKNDGDSLGGIFEIVATGLPPGLGSHVQSYRKLDSMLAGALMSIQAIKGVEIGLGFEDGRRPGSEVHDEITYKDKRFARRSNNAGGIEGGMTNGENIVVRAVMKPIPTLYKPLKSVDIESKEEFDASIERSDVCAVPAASVVGEAVVAFELAKVFLEKFGGDSMEEIERNYNSYMEYVEEY